jgi:hypothetical protein
MKFNWGHGIFLFYSLFALSLIVVVIKSTEFDNSLVADDYYAKDITYQRMIDRKTNSQELERPVELRRIDGGFNLIFPEAILDGRVEGTAHFYRPSSSDFDKIVALKTGETGSMFLSSDGLSAGFYRLKVEWSAGGTEYYDEFAVHLRP